MINEKTINDVREEVLAVAVESGARQAFWKAADLYPEQAENILNQVSVKLEQMGKLKTSERLDQIIKESF